MLPQTLHHELIRTKIVLYILTTDSLRKLMLKLNKLTDYATVILTYLSNLEGSPVTARDIATNTHIKLPTVSKILKKLTRHQLLTSSRGAQGGYILARDAKNISLIEIINAIEYPVAMTECSQHNSHCALEPHCSIRNHWQLINRVIYGALSNVSLADLAAPLKYVGIKLHRGNNNGETKRTNQ